MISDELISQIRDSADLVQIISESVELKRMGGDWRGPCPFHGGTHRNFVVVPKKGLYYCFVCHESGDVFRWQMKRSGADYPTAVREIASRYGIKVPERSDRIGPDPHEPLYQAVAVAQQWFAQQLTQSAIGESAREYLRQRNVSIEAAAELGLGFAPGGAELTTAMAQLGVGGDVLLAAGLLSQRDDGAVRPRFRNRLLFPIEDQRGRPVAFGGRLLGAGEPKYLNSPETPIFSKGRLLYNLSHAKNAIRMSGTALVVEGYFDVQRLVMAGVENVVAPLGTALTAEQAALLKRFTPSVTLIYDSDAPGLRATFRSGDELLAQGVRVLVATLPAGEDPDSLVQARGAAGLAGLLETACDILELKLQILERKGWLRDVEHRREALDRLLPSLRATADPVMRDLYLGVVAERLGISREVLAAEVSKARYFQPHQARSYEATGAKNAPRHRDQRRPPAGYRDEVRLLEVLIADARWIERSRELVPVHYVETPVLSEIYVQLLAASEAASSTAVVESLSFAARGEYLELMERVSGRSGYRWDEEFAAVVQALAERAIERRIEQIADPTERAKQQRQLSAPFQARRQFRKQADRRRTSTRDLKRGDSTNREE